VWGENVVWGETVYMNLAAFATNVVWGEAKNVVWG
jgi:hypothetical protein